MFDSIFPKHWTTLQRLMWLKTNALARAVYETISGNPVSFSAKAAPLRKLEVAFSPVQEGTGDPSPTNVRPISGWSSLGVEQRGKNLWDEEWEYGNIRDDDGTPDGSNVNYWRSKNYIPVKSGATYYHNTGGYTGNFRHFFYSADKTWISTVTPTASASGDVTGLSFTVPAGAAFMKFRYYTSHDSNPNNSINYPSTDIDYVPYNPSSRSISISLGQTVYSGYVDVISGVLTVDMYGVYPANYLSTTGSVTQKNGYSEARVIIDTPAYGGQYSKLLCDKLPYATAGDKARISGYADRIFINIAGTLTAEEWKTAIADMNPFVVYPLAEPLTIQLTPQEVQSLAGDNVIFSDANGDLTVEYRSN